MQPGTADVSTEALDAEAGHPEGEGRPVQVAWAFLHRGETALAIEGAYDLRQRLLQRFPLWPHLEVSVRGSKGATTVYARTPAASAWLSDHMGEVMGLMAAVADRVIPVDPRTTQPSLRRTGRHLHYIRTLIVEKARKSSNWEGWRSEDLTDAKRAELAAMIADGLRSELLRWKAIDPGMTMNSLIVTDVGRPMPIVPASGPRGLARIGVKFIAPWAIEGHVFAGHHTLMGYGMVRRGGQLPTQRDPRVQQSNFSGEVA